MTTTSTPQRAPSRGKQPASRDAATPPDSAAAPAAATAADGSPTAASAAGPSFELSEAEYRGLFSWAKKKAKAAVNSVKDAVTSVSLDQVKDVVKGGLPWAGGAIGGFFGGPAGAAIGGKAGGIAGGLLRDAPATSDEARTRAVRAIRSLEVEAAQLDEIIDRVLDQALPVVIDELAREYADSGSRGVDSDSEEVMERFWGKAFGKIASTVADELPWVIKKVTQYLGEDASRDTGAIDPIMVDSETAQRFWAPAFSAVIAAIQSTVPSLFQQLAGGDRSAAADSTELTWAALEGTVRLSEGDAITVTGQSQIDDPAMVEIGLELPPHKSWWKSVQVRGADDTVLANIEVEGEMKTASALVPAAALHAPGACLVFTKADAMHRLPASELPSPQGTRFDFYWYAG